MSFYGAGRSSLCAARVSIGPSKDILRCLPRSLPHRRLASDTSQPPVAPGLGSSTEDSSTPTSPPSAPPSKSPRPVTAFPPPSPLGSSQASQSSNASRPYPYSSSRPAPPPSPPPPERNNRGKLFWGAQAFFAIGLAGLGGYYLAARNNATLAANPTQDVTLVPSVIGIKRQEVKQPSYGTSKDYENAIDALKAMVRRRGLSIEDRISTDEDDLETHGISDWSYHDEKRPTVVVWVETTEEVQEVMLIARQYKVPITPYGGATSLEGHFSSPFGGISLDMSRMDKILRISEADGDATVQCGVKWEDLNAHLAEKKIPLFFPLDPGPGASIGGMVGTGCSGTNAVRYGTAKGEWFLNLTVVLPSGEVIKTRQRARKSSAGWDTTKLFIGAEGTLGIVTEATLRLAPLMPTKCAVVTFKGVEEAVSAATEVVNAGFPVQCVEFLDARTMKAINQGGISGRQYPEKDCLFFKFQGSDSAMTDVSKGVQAVTKRHGGADFIFSKSDKEAQDLWQGRKAALWSVMALKEGCRVWTTDVCVPISKLPRLIRETTEDFESRGITACHFGHVGDGNVHSLALFSDQEELAKIRVAVHEMVERAIRLDGTCTGEHGVGVGKIEYLDGELGKGTVNLMETVKRTIDPLNLLNPGKLYPHIKPIVHAGGEEQRAPKPQAKAGPKALEEPAVTEPKKAAATEA